VPGVIEITFDPVLRLSETASVRYETIAVAIVVFLGILLAARIASVTPAVVPYLPAPGLRIDDLAFLVIGAVPGAIVGGRLGYVLDHLDYYRANPDAIFDAASGGLSLTLAVPLGMLTSAVIARLLGAPVGRWMHAFALPLLFVLGMGKLVGVLGGTGQGAPSELEWATSYLGAGPWGSLAPEIPAHPSQAYEAILVAIAIVVMFVLSRFEPIARRDGAALFAAIALWAIGRILVGSTWRDPVVAGPLRMEQLLAVVVLSIGVVGFVERWRTPARSGLQEQRDTSLSTA
jgi:phosphatidylglycerol---prolipoprotein diacylglyceryl transferase